ncbi:hypothetical protein [Acidisphaera sp. L21]|uniref:hypothetical protein n=1 Tax=Acidisphaera sp. L21 TaxID=1641851 RepID=UPI00131C7094|nr:hypothetical protein [Acidisphaera sp. L21]
MTHRYHNAPARAVLVTLVGLLAVACFFRFQIGNGFSLLFSDVWDGRIEITILEHWWNVFHGVEPWDRVAYFYPTPHTLGYNDGYFLYGVLYSAYRGLGLDPFLAGEMVNVAMRFAGFVGFYLFARCALSITTRYALLGAAIFTVANNMFMQAVHAQLHTVGLAPIVLWLVWQAAAALAGERPGRAALWGVAAALVYDAWLLTAFYTAWFLALFGVLVVLAWAPLAWWGGQLGWAAMRRWVRWPVGVALAAGAVGAIPFLALYLPRAQAAGMHPFSEILSFATTPLDLLHVGSGNWLFGWLDALTTRTLRPGAADFGERLVGIPPILLICAIAGAALTWRRGRGGNGLWRAVTVALLISVLLMVRFGDVMGWQLVYALVPGAPAVRVVPRFMLFLTLPIILLAIRFVAAQSRHWSALGVGALAALLLLEEGNSFAYIRLDRAEELAFLAAVPPTPSTCRSFFVEGQRGSQSPSFSREDAMFLAEMRRVPTLNGQSSVIPAGMEPLLPGQPEYLARMRQYAAAQRISIGVCALDLGGRSWNVAPFAGMLARLPVNTVLRAGLGGELAPFLLGGWSSPEQSGRWTTGPTAELQFAAPAGNGHGMVLEVRGNGLVPPGRQTQTVYVSVDDTRLAHWEIGPTPAIYRMEIPAAELARGDAVTLRLDIANPVSPKLLGLSNDTRRLGVWLQDIRLVPGAP